MPNPSRHTQNKKPHQTKSFGERTIINYRPGKTNVSCCSNSDKAIAGIPRKDSTKIGKFTGTQRRVGSIYNGNLCHSCLRSLLGQASRNL